MIERDERGRFIKGNDGGPGRKADAERQDIRAMLCKEVPEPEAVALLAKRFRRGEPWAVKLWFAYLWGEPVQKAELGGRDGEVLIINIVRQDDQSVPGAA